jgi:hypothetical protein
MPERYPSKKQKASGDGMAFIVRTNRFVDAGAAHRLPGRPFKLWVVLSRHCNQISETFVGVAKVIGLFNETHKRHFYEDLRYLIKHGWVKIVQKGGGRDAEGNGISTTYKLLVPTAPKNGTVDKRPEKRHSKRPEKAQATVPKKRKEAPRKTGQDQHISALSSIQHQHEGGAAAATCDDFEEKRKAAIEAIRSLEFPDRKRVNGNMPETLVSENPFLSAEVVRVIHAGLSDGAGPGAFIKVVREGGKEAAQRIESELRAKRELAEAAKRRAGHMARFNELYQNEIRPELDKLDSQINTEECERIKRLKAWLRTISETELERIREIIPDRKYISDQDIRDAHISARPFAISAWAKVHGDEFQTRINTAQKRISELTKRAIEEQRKAKQMEAEDDGPLF